jgi:drug/metabolite transporter (DMT)-like permease
MWFVYAFSAAVLWGISYAASGRVIERGMSPLVFFFLYAVVGAVMGGAALVLGGRTSDLGAGIRTIGPDWVWLVIAVVTSALGALLIYLAIGEKNATVASLIEISYPLFVALFAWVFFRDNQFNPGSVLGGALILSGVGMVFWSNR